LIPLLLGLALAAPSLAPASARPLRLVALGDSLTAGYSLPADAAFPAQL
jgi:acyl-CoA thioesterase-1